jgi:hypothetical protein
MVARSLKHMLGALMRACPSAKIAPGPTLLLLLNSLLGTPHTTATAKDSSSVKATSDSPLPVPPPTTESLNGSTKGKKGGKGKGGAPVEGVQGGNGVPVPVAADPAMAHHSLWAAVRSDVSCYQYSLLRKAAHACAALYASLALRAYTLPRAAHRACISFTSIYCLCC